MIEVINEILRWIRGSISTKMFGLRFWYIISWITAWRGNGLGSCYNRLISATGLKRNLK